MSYRRPVRANLGEKQHAVQRVDLMLRFTSQQLSRVHVTPVAIPGDALDDPLVVSDEEGDEVMIDLTGDDDAQPPPPPPAAAGPPAGPSSEAGPSSSSSIPPPTLPPPPVSRVAYDDAVEGFLKPCSTASQAVRNSPDRALTLVVTSDEDGLLGAFTGVWDEPRRRTTSFVLHGQRTREDREGQGIWGSMYKEWLTRLKARAIAEGSVNVSATIPSTGECHRNPSMLIRLVRRGWKANDGDLMRDEAFFQRLVARGKKEVRGVNVVFGPFAIADIPSGDPPRLVQ